MILLGMLTSCGEEIPEPPREKFELISQAAWVPVEDGQDPFSSENIASNCGPGGYKVEATILEIETDICPYVTLKQATVDDVEIGDRIKFHFWHLTLISDPPSEAHVVVQLGSQLKFEQRIAIPASEQIYPVSWEVTERIPKGSDMFLHLHNHGYNSYRLSKVEVIPPSE